MCWGRNIEGQANPPEGETFATISSGAFHTCGLREDGAVILLGLEQKWSGKPAAE